MISPIYDFLTNLAEPRDAVSRGLYFELDKIGQTDERSQVMKSRFVSRPKSRHSRNGLIRLLLFLALLSLLTFIDSIRFLSTKPDTTAKQPSLSPPQLQQLGKMPLCFEANIGQTDKEVQFFSRGPGYRLYLQPARAILVSTGTFGINPPSLKKRTSADVSPDTALESVVQIRLIGANAHAEAAGEQRLATRTNYFIGQDSSKWLKNVPNYNGPDIRMYIRA